MSELLRIASAFFEKQKWEQRTIEHPSAVEVSFSHPRFPWKNYAQAKEDDRIFVYYSLCPENAPVAHRPAVAAFLSHLNFNSIVGAWEMDMESGETRYRSSIDLRGQPLTDALLLGVVQANHQAVLSHLPSLLQVMRGELSPRQAYLEAIDE
jgi:hypothetical protein